MVMDVFEGGGIALKERIESTGEKPSALLVMRSARLGQIEYQHRNVFGHFRTGGLLRRLPKGHACKILVEKELGVSVETFMDLATLIMTACKASEGGWLDRTRLDELQIAYGADFTKVFGLLAKTPVELRAWLRDAFPPKGNRSRELNQFPVFKQAPIVKFSSRECRVWHQSVFDRFLDEYLHLVLSRHGEQYTKPFSKVFEAYVLDVVRQTGTPFITATDYLSRYYPAEKTRKKNVEAILSDEGGKRRVLVEAKMSLFADDDLAQETRKGAGDKLKNTVLKGLRQGRAVSQRLRTEPGADDEKHFLLIVTSRELHLGTGPMLREVCGEAALAPDDDGIHHLLPDHHVFIVSTHEFELLMGHVGASRLKLFDLLEKVATRCEDLSANRYTLSEFYKDDLPRGGEASWMAKLVREEIEACTARVERKLLKVPVGSSIGGGAPKGV